VEIRDSKARGAGPIIDFTPVQWGAFVCAAVHGLPSGHGAVAVTHDQNGTQVRSITNGTILSFTPGEWAAFVAGARDGEFDYQIQVAALTG
jgi:hypothetical protein